MALIEPTSEYEVGALVKTKGILVTCAPMLLLSFA